MNIKETFLKLTSRTYPYGSESQLVGLLPKFIKQDNYGNYYLKIGKSKTIFASHLDTACKKSSKVKHIIDGNIIKTNGKTILGADDKAGVTVLLYMIQQKVPGLYYFFIGEEVGCIGSKAAAAKDDFSKYERIISFDRRDTCSIITHQGWSRCCSNDFANELSKAYIDLGLELKPDDTGVHTDSAEFTDIISECTNISVGYYKEHTHDEHQDIDFLEKLCMASVIIDWESLPTVRDFRITEYKSYNHNYIQQGHRQRRREEFEERERNRVARWNRNYEFDDAYIPLALPPGDENRLAYGYNNYDLEDDDNAVSRGRFLDLRNRNKKGKIVPKEKMSIRQFNNIGKDIYLTYKDSMANKFTVDEYSIIQEQYIDILD